MWEMPILMDTLLEEHHLYYSNLYLAKFFWLMCMRYSLFKQLYNSANGSICSNSRNCGDEALQHCIAIIRSKFLSSNLVQSSEMMASRIGKYRLILKCSLASIVSLEPVVCITKSSLNFHGNCL